MISFLRYATGAHAKIVTILLTAMFSCSANGQQGSIAFSPLGSTQYQTRINQLEKYIAPKKYTEKSAQEWYEEMMTDRNKALMHLFKDDGTIYDTLLLNKCNSIGGR